MTRLQPTTQPVADLGQIGAYLARWDVVTPTKRGSYLRTQVGCMDSWLSATPVRVPIVVAHEGDPVGWWTHFEADNVGLLARGRLDDSPRGLEVARQIRDDEFVACSFRGRPRDSKEAGVTATGEIFLDLIDVVLVEGGPCVTPADPGALIIELDGVRLRDATQPPGPVYCGWGLHPSPDEVLTAMENRWHARERQIRETIDLAKRLGSRLDDLQNALAAAWVDPDGIEVYLRLTRVEHDVDVALRDTYRDLIRLMRARLSLRRPEVY